jgi:hypothetical protein
MTVCGNLKILPLQNSDNSTAPFNRRDKFTYSPLHIWVFNEDGTCVATSSPPNELRAGKDCFPWLGNTRKIFFRVLSLEVSDLLLVRIMPKSVIICSKSIMVDQGVLSHRHLKLRRFSSAPLWLGNYRHSVYKHPGVSLIVAWPYQRPVCLYPSSHDHVACLAYKFD